MRRKGEGGQDFGRSRFTLRDGKSEGNWSEVQKSITVRKHVEAPNLTVALTHWQVGWVIPG